MGFGCGLGWGAVALLAAAESCRLPEENAAVAEATSFINICIVSFILSIVSIVFNGNMSKTDCPNFLAPKLVNF